MKQIHLFCQKQIHEPLQRLSNFNVVAGNFILDVDPPMDMINGMRLQIFNRWRRYLLWKVVINCVKLFVFPHLS